MWTRVLGPGEYGPGAFRWGNVCGLRCSDGRAGVCAAASVLILPKAGFSGWDGFFFFWCFCCRSRIADVSIYRRRRPFSFPWWRRIPLWQGVNERLWDVGKKSGKTLFCLRYFLLAFPSSPSIFKHFFVLCRFAHWCFCIPRRSFHVKICRHCLAHIGFLERLLFSFCLLFRV